MGSWKTCWSARRWQVLTRRKFRSWSIYQTSSFLGLTWAVIPHHGSFWSKNPGILPTQSGYFGFVALPYNIWFCNIYSWSKEFLLILNTWRIISVCHIFVVQLEALVLSLSLDCSMFRERNWRKSTCFHAQVYGLIFSNFQFLLATIHANKFTIKIALSV